MDTNGAIGDFDPGTGVVTIHANSMNFTYFLWLIAGSLKIPAGKLRLVPVAAGGSFGSKFFMHKVPTFAGFLSMLVGQAGQVRRGPRHPHRQQRPLRLGPPLRGVARVRRRRRVQGAADLLHRRLRRLPPVRHRHPRQRALADRRALSDPARRVLAGRGADEQEPAGRVPGLRRRGLELDARAARRPGRARPRSRPRRDPAAQPDPAPARSRTGRRPGTSTTAATTRACWRRCSRRSTTTTGSTYREQARAEGRHVGIGVVASQERSVFSSTEFWFWFDDPQFTPTSSPESASVLIDPTGQIVVTLHSQSMWGNSPETVVSQVVAEEFDVDPASIVDHLRRFAERAAGHRAGRLALHGDGLRRRRRRVAPS